MLTNAEQLSPESTSLLLSSPPFTSLDALLPDLASLVSTNLQSSAVQLARAANPGTNASFLHRHIASVPGHIDALAASVAQETRALAVARAAAADALVRLLDGHTRALARVLGALEAKHGPVARSLELRGHEAALEAARGEVGAASALWAARRDVYAPEVREALRNYALHVRDGQRRLREAVRSAEAVLAEYGVRFEGAEGGGGGGDGSGDANRERRFREIARAHRDARRQIDEAKRDLNRLR